MVIKMTKHWPLLTASGALWVTIGVLFLIITTRTGGYNIYLLDDPYIHMAMAKNLSQSGTWGINAHQFSSSSSSLLWTLLLACAYAAFGVNEITPFLLNLAAATLVVFVTYAVLRRQKPELPQPYIFVALLLVVYSIELPSLVFCGMETTLHVMLVLLFVHFAAKTISSEGRHDKKDLALLLACSVLATSIRYECAALILIVCALLFIKRKRAASCAVALTGASPLVAYGIISHYKGGFWVPNTIVIKSRYDFTSVSSMPGVVMNIYRRFLGAPEILALFVIAVILFILEYRKGKSIRDYKTAFLAIFIAAALIQVGFSEAGMAGLSIYSFRYEAYIAALGIVAVLLNIYGYLPGRMPRPSLVPRYLALLMVVSLPFVFFGRNWWFLSRTPQAAYNIYEQQYQMGMFLNRYYKGKSVALNDIGAANYFGDITCIDLYGLGSVEVAREKLDSAVSTNGMLKTRLTPEQMDRLARDADIAIIYENWFKGSIPGRWSKVGEWEIKDNVTCGGGTVSFYAVNAAGSERLRENLADFSLRLPPDVIQRFM